MKWLALRIHGDVRDVVELTGIVPEAPQGAEHLEGLPIQDVDFLIAARDVQEALGLVRRKGHEASTASVGIPAGGFWATASPRVAAITKTTITVRSLILNVWWRRRGGVQSCAWCARRDGRFRC